ncbi:MAG: ABC transporter ATP-binding protein [Chitinivibrionales bacterium]
MTLPVIHCDRLVKKFGKNVVIEDCSFDIAQGSIFGLVGLNGAGKTTLIRVLLGLLKPSGGAVSVLGRVPWDHSESLYQRTGVVLENDGFSGNMTVKDNLRIFAAAKGLTWESVKGYVREFWADTFIHDEMFGPSKRVKYLSRGQRMQCSVCRAFLGWPEVYLFDEPTVALDVAAYDHFCFMCRIARGLKGTMIISSHQLSAIEELCDLVGILDNKKLHMLDSGAQSPEGGPWTIVMENVPGSKEIIESAAGSAASYYEGAWHVALQTPRTTVPDVVARLVRAGCGILEVRPEKQDLKDRIRTHYEKT